MKNKFLKNREKGQSITEYAILFVIVAAVLVFSIIGTNLNGPVSIGLSGVFTRIMSDVSNSLDNLVN